jgi:CheY-like chemotaxis protein
LISLLAEEGFDARHVTSARAALECIAAERFDCMILDLGLPDMDGLGLLTELERASLPHTPAVVVYTGRALTRAEAGRLEAYTQAVVFKDGKSTDRLLEEIRLFVRHVREGARANRRSWTLPPLSAGTRLEGKRVLLADDDMRTVYALSALLRTKGAEVLIADSGKSALELLEKNPDVDAVLMDVMMPEMDGYEAIRQIRRDARFRALPIVALTAKAMKGERDRCLAEGASDYLTKPVEAERLLSVLANWLRLDHAGSGS